MLERPNSRITFRVRRSTVVQGTQQSSSSSGNSHFGNSIGSTLGSPFLTTAELPGDEIIDGASQFVPTGHAVTRPVSPAMSVDYSMLNAPTFDYATPTRTRTPYSGSPSPNALKALLPRLWDALSSPAKKGKGKRLLEDTDGSLDGDDYEFVEDEGLGPEACYLRVHALTGIDIIALLPPEVSLQLLMFLDIIEVVTCMTVSKTWRSLAGDNAVWRELFGARDWKLDADRATLRRLQNPSVLSTTARIGQVFEEWGRRTRLTSVSSNASTPRSTRSMGATTPRSTKKLPPIPWGSSEGIFESSFPTYDWRDLYKTRSELERRWETAEPKKTVLAGHADSVYCLEFDSARIITGSRDKSIKIWSLTSGRLLSTHNGHEGSVLCVKFDKDWDVVRNRQPAKPGFMVSGSSDCTVRVWDLHVGENEDVRAETRAILRGHTGGVLDLRIDEDWIVSCSKDALICVWDRQTLALHCTLRGHQGPVNAVGLQTGKVVSASGDGKMMLWDIQSGKRIRTFAGHDRGLACIEFNGDLIVSGSNDCKIKVWSASTGECLMTLTGHELLVRARSFDPIGGRLVSASYDKSIKVWNLNTGKLIRDIKTSHTSHIFDVKFDVSRIVSTSHDQKVVILDFGESLDTAIFA